MEIIGRMMLALGIVLAIMWALAKVARRPKKGRSDLALTVLARQQLGRSSSVAVIKVADRALVIGVTDQSVRLLAETDVNLMTEAVVVDAEPSSRPARGRRSVTRQASRTSIAGGPAVLDAGATTSDEFSTVLSGALEQDEPLPAKPTRRAQPAGRSQGKNGALDGSILSPAVWRQLVGSARELTVRR